MLDEFLIILAAQPVVPALAALLIDRLWPRASARPPEMVARVVASLVERLNREGRPAATRQMRGFLLWSLVSLLALGAGLAVADGLRQWLPPLAVSLAEAALMAAGIGFAAARATALRAAEGVASLVPARAVSVATVACDRLAGRLADGPVALVLGWLLLGLPGVFMLKAGQWLVNGVETDRDGAFGRAVRACHALVTLPASMIAAVLIGFGRPPVRGLDPAADALRAALLRRGFDAAAPAERVAAARLLVDRAHALWLLVLIIGGLLAAGLV
ncbi:MAG: hypothetical protein OJI70_02415 [Zavarzinia sp.]|nr:hypothetical protein [Zavarzinia sp.]